MESNLNRAGIDRNNLCDIKNVLIDTTLPQRERIKSFVNQIKNPYCYLDDGVVVEIGYAKTDISLHDRLIAYTNNISGN